MRQREAGNRLFAEVPADLGRVAVWHCATADCETAHESSWQHVSALTLWRNLWQHRALIGRFAWREFRSRYVGSSLGILWTLLTPLCMLVLYTAVFRGVLHAQWDVLPGDSAVAFAVNLFAGLVVFNLFAEVVGRSPHLILNHPQFVKKVVFPLEILPVTTLLAALGQALASLLVVGLASALWVRVPGWHVLWLPIILAPYLGLLAGLSWLTSAIGTFWRDLGPMVTVGMHGWLFLTPIFYPLSAAPPRWRFWLQLNPLAAYVENVRRVWLGNLSPDFGSWSATALASLVIMQAGYWCFLRNKRAFADVV